MKSTYPVLRPVKCVARINGAKNFSAQKQKGMALATSLIFLLILTLFAVVSMNTGTLQQKMAGNLRDSEIALQSSESVLRYGERTLKTMLDAAGDESPRCANAINNLWCLNQVQWDLKPFWLANGLSYMGDGAKQIEEAFEDPRVIIESYAADEGLAGTNRDSLMVADNTGVHGTRMYRLSARGVGASGITESILEGYYIARKNL